MTAETNTPTKPKVKEPQRPPPTVESVTNGYGWGIGRSNSGANRSSLSQDGGEINAATAVFTNIIMRQMAEGGGKRMPEGKGGRPLRQHHIRQLQTQYGNRQTQNFVQRNNGEQPSDVFDSASSLPTFDFSEKSDEREGQPFDASYRPVGPAPQIGDLDIFLWVHITYRNFLTQTSQKPRVQNR